MVPSADDTPESLDGQATRGGEPDSHPGWYNNRG